MAAFAGIVFFYAARNISSNSGVKGIVRTGNYIDMPHIADIFKALRRYLLTAAIFTLRETFFAVYRTVSAGLERNFAFFLAF